MNGLATRTISAERPLCGCSGGRSVHVVCMCDEQRSMIPAASDIHTAEENISNSFHTMNKKIVAVASVLSVLMSAGVAFADSVAFSVSDATSTTNTMFGNIETTILYGLGTLLLAAVGLGMVGFFWRHIKRIVGLKRF